MTQNQNNCAETHLGGGDMSAFVSPWPPLLERSLRLPVAVPFLGKAHEDSDHTPVIAVVHQRLHAETHRAGEVASAVIMSSLPFGRHCSRSTERGCHVVCALIGTYCATQPGLQHG